jgi:hypothetical protein
LLAAGHKADGLLRKIVAKCKEAIAGLPEIRRSTKRFNDLRIGSTGQIITDVIGPTHNLCTGDEMDRVGYNRKEKVDYFLQQ